jgi:hypothetical protein
MKRDYKYADTECFFCGRRLSRGRRKFCDVRCRNAFNRPESRMRLGLRRLFG